MLYIKKSIHNFIAASVVQWLYSQSNILTANRATATWKWNVHYRQKQHSVCYCSDTQQHTHSMGCKRCVSSEDILGIIAVSGEIHSADVIECKAPHKWISVFLKGTRQLWDDFTSHSDLKTGFKIRRSDPEVAMSRFIDVWALGRVRRENTCRYINHSGISKKSILHLQESLCTGTTQQTVLSPGTRESEWREEVRANLAKKKKGGTVGGLDD